MNSSFDFFFNESLSMSKFRLFADIDECGGHHRSKRSYWWYNVFSQNSGRYLHWYHNFFVMLPRANHNKASRVMFRLTGSYK